MKIGYSVNIMLPMKIGYSVNIMLLLVLIKIQSHFPLEIQI